jgi:hypothetical protein
MKRAVPVLAVVVSLVVAGACASEPQRKGDAAIDDGDAGHSEMTGDPVAPVEPIADDGPPADGTDKPTPRPLPTRPLPSSPPGPPKVDPIQITIFNRYLVKPKDQALPEAEIKQLVEEATGAKVAMVRRTAVGWWLVQLEPVTPPRTAEDQQKVIGLLQAGGAFAVVERDQIMQIR